MSETPKHPQSPEEVDEARFENRDGKIVYKPENGGLEIELPEENTINPGDEYFVVLYGQRYQEEGKIDDHFDQVHLKSVSKGVGSGGNPEVFNYEFVSYGLDLKKEPVTVSLTTSDGRYFYQDKENQGQYMSAHIGTNPNWTPGSK